MVATAPAIPIGEPGEGVKLISTQFNVTRIHNALECVSSMRRQLALLSDYAKNREAFGNKLIDLPLFDEVISGFRINLGGAQKEYSVTPDLACFGKAMANGYPISALVGRRKIMKKMEKIFFSTTFGGELSSIAAAIATIQKLEDLKVIEKIKFTGCRLKNDINNIINKLNLESIIQFSGEDWWPRIDLKDNRLDSKYLLALLRQEFSKNGLLIASSLNMCFSHTNDSVISESLIRIENALKSFLIAVNSKDPKDYLEGELVFSDFNVRSKLRGFDYDN